MRQTDLARRAGVSRQLVARLEAGEAPGTTLATIARVTEALGARLAVRVTWRGEALDRLMDAAHARIQTAVAEALTNAGWLVLVEVSFNRYGERGRVDILASRESARTLLVVEVKSTLSDLQDTVGRLDMKVRLGKWLARSCNWAAPTRVLPALVIGDSRSGRRIVAAHDALFARFDTRGRQATAWIRQPSPAATGLLWFTNGSNSHQTSTRPRVRVAKRRTATPGVNLDRTYGTSPD
jgi:transcriptional regulator with XRE-family HTH domain